MKPFGNTNEKMFKKYSTTSTGINEKGNQGFIDNNFDGQIDESIDEGLGL